MATAVASRPHGSLSLLAGGAAAANPPALLASDAMEELLRSLAADRDYVLIDAPSPLRGERRMPLLPLVDGIVIVAARRAHARGVGRRLVQLLVQASSATVLGVVANGVPRPPTSPVTASPRRRPRGARPRADEQPRTTAPGRPRPCARGRPARARAPQRRARRPRGSPRSSLAVGIAVALPHPSYALLFAAAAGAVGLVVLIGGKRLDVKVAVLALYLLMLDGPVKLLAGSGREATSGARDVLIVAVCLSPVLSMVVQARTRRAPSARRAGWWRGSRWC